jgi:hypothetical protein
MNIQFQNTSYPPWALLPIRIEVFEAVLEHISFEQAKNFCDSLGTICVGEGENIFFSHANKGDGLVALVEILTTTAKDFHTQCTTFHRCSLLCAQSSRTAPHVIFP